MSVLVKRGLSAVLLLAFASLSLATPWFPSTGVNNSSPLPDGLTAVMHNATIADDAGVSGYVFSWTGTNCTTWANDSWVSFTANNTNASITKIVPVACEGKQVQWRVYANDSGGLWAVSQTQTWQQDTTVNASLPDIGDHSKPSAFYLDKWYLISGEKQGGFFGFDWTGSAWEQNSTINASLPDIGQYSKPSVFQIGSQWFLISGETNGGFFGFDWNGTGWTKNSTINASLPDVGSGSAPSVFQIGSQWFMIAGSAPAGTFFGFDWNGTGWTQNSTINASLPVLSEGAPSVFQMGSQWFLIAGQNSGPLFGFDWNGTGWTQNSTINASLPDIGDYSKPSVFQKDGLWQIIAGENSGLFYGFGHNPAYSVQSVAPVVSTKAVNATVTNPSTSVCVNATASDVGVGVSVVWQTVTFPNSTAVNITLQNSTSIDGCGGGGSVWSQQISVGATSGSLYLNTTWANDSSGTLGSNTTLLTVLINAPPFLSNLFTNQSSPQAGESVMHNASVYDDVGLVGYVFSWSASGASCDTWANESWVSYTANNSNISVTKVIPGNCESKSISWRYYANDSLGLWGASSVPSWQQNSTINASLPDVGDWSAPSVFQIGSQWFMISGRDYGNFYGFDWTGSAWEQNSTINASLPGLGSDSTPSVFKMGTQWFLIVGEYYGKFFGFDWNGTGWTKNSTINASLPDIGTTSAPNVFQIGSQWFLIAGEQNGKFFGFDWNGTGWTKNSTINASLPSIGNWSEPSVFQIGSQWFLISGGLGGGFFGFDWNGTGWTQNSTINASLPDIGAVSKPNVFQIGSQRFLISGETGGKFFGFHWLEPYVVQNVSPAISTMAVNTTSTSPSTTICTNATVVDVGVGVSTVWQTFTFPNATVVNITLQNSTSIDGCGGGESVWSQQIGVGSTVSPPNFTVNATWANDTLGNSASNSTALNASVYENSPSGGGGGGTGSPIPHSCGSDGICYSDCVNDPDCIVVTPSPTPSPAPISSPTPTSSPMSFPTKQPSVVPTGKPVANQSQQAVTAGQVAAKLTQLRVLLLQAEQVGINTASAESLIKLAQQSLSAGDYAEALVYMTQAEDELRKSIEDMRTPTGKAGGFDSLLLGVVAALALAGGYYYFFMRNKRKGL